MNHLATQQILRLRPLEQETLEALKVIAEEKTLSKNEILVNEGEIFNYEIFLVIGVVRCYNLTDNDKEYTSSFYTDGQFLSPSFSRQVNGRSSTTIQALEDCQLILFKETSFTKLRYHFQDLFILGGKIAEKELLSKSLKEARLATGNLKSLYLFFQQNYPGLENRIAQRHVASYIGSDPVSLSRVRSELIKKNK